MSLFDKFFFRGGKANEPEPYEEDLWDKIAKALFFHEDETIEVEPKQDVDIVHLTKEGEEISRHTMKGVHSVKVETVWEDEDD